MGLFFDAAKAWHDLHHINYVLYVARKRVVKRIEITFLDEDFPHLAGMQYAKDVDFGIRKSEYYGAALVPALLTRRMNDAKIEGSRNWNRISGRLKAIIHLQRILEGEFIIVSFDKKKVIGYSDINAKFAIKSAVSGEIYFVFFDERSGKYYCKSAFQQESNDYIKNQMKMTILRIEKISDQATTVLYNKEGYSPDSGID